MSIVIRDLPYYIMYTSLYLNKADAVATGCLGHQADWWTGTM